MHHYARRPAETVVQHEVLALRALSLEHRDRRAVRGNAGPRLSEITILTLGLDALSDRLSALRLPLPQHIAAEPGDFEMGDGRDLGVL